MIVWEGFTTDKITYIITYNNGKWRVRVDYGYSNTTSYTFTTMEEFRDFMVQPRIQCMEIE